jgi:hypothetical protein
MPEKFTPTLIKITRLAIFSRIYFVMKARTDRKPNLLIQTNMYVNAKSCRVESITGDELETRTSLTRIRQKDMNYNY